MSVKELTQLTVTDLMKEYKRSFWSYWEEHDEAIKEFRRRHIERVLETERAQLICYKPHGYTTSIRITKLDIGELTTQIDSS